MHLGYGTRRLFHARVGFGAAGGEAGAREADRGVPPTGRATRAILTVLKPEETAVKFLVLEAVFPVSYILSSTTLVKALCGPKPLYDAA